MIENAEYMEVVPGPLPVERYLYKKLTDNNSDYLAKKREFGFIKTFDFPDNRGETKVLIFLPEQWGETVNWKESFFSDDGYILNIPICNLHGDTKLRTDQVRKVYEINDKQYTILRAKPRIEEV